jgi:hypothetical protein
MNAVVAPASTAAMLYARGPGVAEVSALGLQAFGKAA